jgi:hypothetical protein
MRVSYEYTDTFGGEANYSWCRRGSFNCGGSDLSIIRRVKKELGLNGVKCRKEDNGDLVTLIPIGSNTIVFISFE